MFGKAMKTKDVVYQRHECGKVCREVEIKRSLMSGGRWSAYRWNRPMVPVRHCPGCGELLEVERDAKGN